jgi:membrane-bound lytic murein transglycosylase A
MAQALKEIQFVLMRMPDPKARTKYLKKRLLLFRSRGSDEKGSVLFTGYYEPVLPARKEAKPPYIYPLYSVPENLLTVNLRDFGPKLPNRRLVARVEGKKVVPYHARDEIDFQGAIAGKAKPLAYLADPIEAFFFHIQGSGQVVFSDGSRLRLGYAASNGHPYRSIGKFLISEGLMDLDNMSMQAIKDFLNQRPRELKRVLSHNPSYVFFRPLKAEGGPLGCYATELTAGRSIATDRRQFPGLAPAYIIGQMPNAQGGTTPFSRFVLNQDTGGAIRGPGRLDLFFGSGPEAGELAGRMKYRGQLFFLAPKL